LVYVQNMIRVFIGTEEAQWLPTEVLKHSILRRTQEPVEFTELKNLPLKLTFKMYTGFSLYRFYIPEACHYEGRALYLDADIVVLCDLKELMELDMQGKGALSRHLENADAWYTSVMLMDCSKLKSWKLKEWVAMLNAGIVTYQGIMSADKTGMNHKDFGNLEEKWNHLDHFDNTTKIIHYTNVPTQPWKKGGHPNRHVFLKEMKAALDDKIITVEDVKREIAAGHIYPAILEDMEKAVT